MQEELKRQIESLKIQLQHEKLNSLNAQEELRRYLADADRTRLERKEETSINDEFSAHSVSEESVRSRLESKQGLPALIYLVSVAGGQAKAKPTCLRKVVDRNGVARIECALPNVLETSRCEGDVARDSNSIRKLRFRLTDLKVISRAKGVSISIPESVNDDLCLSLVVEGKGEVNLVMPSAAVREFAADVIQSYVQDDNFLDEFLEPEPIPQPVVTSQPVTPNKSSTHRVNISTDTDDGKSALDNDVSLSPKGYQTYQPNEEEHVSILMKGWITKEDRKQSHVLKAWTKRFMVLEYETKTLKYGVSDAFLLGFPSQLRGILKLENGFRCGVSRTMFSSTILEIISPSGIMLRIQADNEKETHQWLLLINAVIDDNHEAIKEAKNLVT